FVAQGCGRSTMDMVLVGEDGAALPEFKIAGSRRVRETDMVLPSLEVAGPGGHWVEVSRAICPGTPSAESQRMLEAYDEYYAAARKILHDGTTAHDAHRAVSKGFTDRGWALGHVTGHSIGMTMIEFPKIGEGIDTVLRSGMVLSMHPHVISDDGQACLYMQDTWLVTDDGGVPLADLPMKIFDGTEARP
ncbi:MAG: M24 family metallopeptidase, partial [Actinobacteria bacterium]|nr:M24 family metallopeptidase [Actinomycetota bacterium]